MMGFKSPSKGFVFNSKLRIYWFLKGKLYIIFTCARNYFEQDVDCRGIRSEAGYWNVSV